MFDWWESLSVIQKIFGYMAIPGTVIMIVQTVLVIIGIGDGDADMDADIADGDVSDVSEGPDGLALVSIRGVVAFFAVGGWTGILLDGMGLHVALTILISVVAGALALLAVGYILSATRKLQDRGNIQLANAVGKTAKVYITVPENGKSGKVNLTVQGRFSEFDAVTHSGKRLVPGQSVLVTGLEGENTLVVSLPEDEPEKQS